jgi:hypothetical protein
MRDYATIYAEIVQAQAAYHEKPEGVGLPMQIKALRKELSAFISQGAVECPECKLQPHGMIKRFPVPAIPDPLFEVGCLNCFRRSRGALAELAVKRWNDGEYVDRHPKPKERAIGITASEG